MSKKQKTREAILNTAWELFESKGYSNTSTRDIASAAGIANGTVFSHFATKLDILKEGFQAQLDKVLMQAAIQDSYTSPVEKLVHYAGFLYQFYLSNLEFSREIFKAIIFNWEELEAELENFKRALFANTHFQQQAANLMIDAYFMTLMDGLNKPELGVPELQSQLQQKLALIQMD